MNFFLRMNALYIFSCVFFSLLVRASSFVEKDYWEDIVRAACKSNPVFIEYKMSMTVSSAALPFSKYKTEDGLFEGIFEDLTNAGLIASPTSWASPRYVWGLKRLFVASFKKYYPHVNTFIVDQVETCEQLKSACETLFKQVLSNPHFVLGKCTKEAMFRLLYLFVSFNENYPRKATFSLKIAAVEGAVISPKVNKRGRPRKSGPMNVPVKKVKYSTDENSPIPLPQVTTPSTGTNNNTITNSEPRSADNSEHVWSGNQQLDLSSGVIPIPSYDQNSTTSLTGIFHSQGTQESPIILPYELLSGSAETDHFPHIRNSYPHYSQEYPNDQVSNTNYTIQSNNISPYSQTQPRTPYHSTYLQQDNYQGFQRLQEAYSQNASLPSIRAILPEMFPLTPNPIPPNQQVSQQYYQPSPAMIPPVAFNYPAHHHNNQPRPYLPPLPQPISRTRNGFKN